MAQITVRKLDEELLRTLKIQAAEHGRSAEAEVRVILAESLTQRTGRRTFVEHLLAIPTDLSDQDPFPRIEGTPRDVEL